MANQILAKASSIMAVLACVLIFVTFVQSQGLSQDEDECGGCWSEMEDVLTTASDYLKGDFYRHRDHVTEHERPRASRRLSYSVFRRSLDSNSVECDSCWIVLERLRTYIQNSRDKDVSNLGHLVKKAMLNNGWV